MPIQIEGFDRSELEFYRKVFLPRIVSGVITGYNVYREDISYEEPFVIDKRNPEYVFLRVLLPFELLMPRFATDGSYLSGTSDLGLWDVQTPGGVIPVRVYGNVLFDDSNVINPNVINL